MSRIRQREIHTRRVRKLKLKKLRVALTESKGGAQKDTLIAKLGRLAPWMTEKDLAGKKK